MKAITTLVAVLASSISFSDTPVTNSNLPTTPPASGPTTSPAYPYAGLSLSGGLDFIYHPNSTNTWYNFTFKGNPLTQGGAKPGVLDSSSLFSLPGTAAQAGATPGFQLNLFKGTGNLTGTAFDGTDLQNFAIPKIELGNDFMVQSDVGGSLDGKALNGQVGIEHLPYHLSNLGLDKGELANWFIPGVAGAESWASGQPSTPGTGIFTLRAFIGKAWGWTQSQSAKAPFTVSDFLKQYPNYDAMVKAARALPDTGKNLGAEDAFLLQRASDSTDSANYSDRVNKTYAEYVTAYQKAPSYTFWFESKDWYTFAGNPQGDRWKPMFAAVFTIWRDFGSAARSSLEFRYENGFEWSDQTTRWNRLMVTAGLNF